MMFLFLVIIRRAIIPAMKNPVHGRRGKWPVASASRKIPPGRDVLFISMFPGMRGVFSHACNNAGISAAVTVNSASTTLSSLNINGASNRAVPIVWRVYHDPGLNQLGVIIFNRYPQAIISSPRLMYEDAGRPVSCIIAAPAPASMTKSGAANHPVKCRESISGCPGKV